MARSTLPHAQHSSDHWFQMSPPVSVKPRLQVGKSADSTWASTEPNAVFSDPVIVPGKPPVRSSRDPPTPLARYDACRRKSGNVWFLDNMTFVSPI